MRSTDWLAPGTSTKYRPARDGSHSGGSGSAGASPCQRAAIPCSEARTSSGATAPVTWKAARPGRSAEAWYARRSSSVIDSTVSRSPSRFAARTWSPYSSRWKTSADTAAGLAARWRSVLRTLCCERANSSASKRGSRRISSTSSIVAA